jgi:hypothetical protein
VIEGYAKAIEDNDSEEISKYEQRIIDGINQTVKN